MKHLIKRAAALAMAMAMALTLTTWASAADYTDMPSNWAKVPMEAAVENGLLKGDNGRLRPGDSLTRAEMAAILVRAFGADQTADLSKFTDVPAGKWYAKELSSAVFMEIMKGSGSALNPEKAITREEAFAVLARALKLQNGSSATLARFTDGSNVSSWFTGEIAAMVEAGFVNGSDGKLNPKANISRQEFAQVMYNIFGVDYIKEAGTYSELGEKSVMINASGVTVKDATIHGDVIIGEGVGEGDVYFDNVTIEGRVVVRGGGVNSIHFTRSTVANVVIAKIVGNVRVVGDRTSTAKIISVADGDAAVVIENLTVTTVDVASADTPVEVRSAVVTTVNVAVAGAEVSLTSNTTVTTVNVAGTAAGSTIKTQAGVTVTTVNAAVNVTVDGGGRVQNVAGTGSVTDTTGKPVTGGSTGGGSIAIGGGGGGTTKPTEPEKPKPDPTPEEHKHTYVWKYSTTQHWKECSSCGAVDAENPKANHGTLDENGACPSGCGYAQKITAGEGALEHTHNWVKDESKSVAATCTTAGKDVYTCSGEAGDPENSVEAKTCTATKEDPISPLGHQWDQGSTTTAPTCLKNGVKTFTCTRGECKETRTEELASNPDAHNLEGVSFTISKTDATKHSKVCKDCKNEVTTTAAAHTGGDFAANPDGKTHSKTCTECGAKYGTENCDYAAKSAPTEDRPGYITKTCKCGSTMVVECEKHEYENGVCKHCGAEEPKVTPENCSKKNDHETLHKGQTCPGGCGYTGTAAHTFDNGKDCSCGAKITAHNWVAGECKAEGHTGCECSKKDSHGDIEEGKTCEECKLPGSKKVEPVEPPVTGGGGEEETTK